MSELPDGWERVDRAGWPFYKLVKRDAVQAPERYAGDEPFECDCVLVVAESAVRIGKGPGLRHSFEDVSDLGDAALRIAGTIEEWLQEGRGPYGNDELTERLEDAVGCEAVVG